MKPLQNRAAQRSTTSTSPRVTADTSRYRFIPKRRTSKPVTPARSTVARPNNIPGDQHIESSNQQSLEEDFVARAAEEISELALALQDIQQAPIPTTRTQLKKAGPYSVTVTPPSIFPNVPTRSNLRYTTAPPTLSPLKLMISTRRSPEALTTRRNSVRYTKPTSRVTPTTIALYKPIEYDYYEDGESILSRIPENSKVLLHSNGVIECLDQGNFPHPVSCKRFISCARMDEGRVLGWAYTCPRDLSFDPIGGICNWSAGLGCNE